MKERIINSGIKPGQELRCCVNGFKIKYYRGAFAASAQVCSARQSGWLSSARCHVGLHIACHKVMPSYAAHT